MPVSCAGSAADFSAPEFARLLADLPSLVVVLEHLGSLSRPDATDVERDQRYDVFGLARYPNVYLKVPGLGEIARRALPPRGPAPFQQPLPDYFERALEAFGPQRLMWGSDFPPVASREGYRNALELCRDQFVALPEVQRALIFGGAARRVFLS
jgi:L-fuconolactonase